MRFNRYYQDELLFLRKLGREFAEKHENAAQLLDEYGTDPDVERLLEGVAFLTGRVRQKLDDELPEITQSLLQVLWPHYLRPVPSASILEFTPRTGMVRGVQKVPRGTMVDARRQNDVTCRFKTCYDVDLYPIKLTGVRLDRPQVGRTLLHLAFKFDSGVTLCQSGMQRMRLFLHGPRRLATTLYHWLMRRTRYGWVQGADSQGNVSYFHLPQGCVQPVGFANDESLLPYPPNSFTGYRYLQEYFSLPEKYLFIDIMGMVGAKDTSIGGEFEVVFDFAEDMPGGDDLQAENIRLHCTPIINLFPMDARPIRIDMTRHEHLLQIDGADNVHSQIFSVDRVSSFVRGSATRREHRPLFEAWAMDAPTHDEDMNVYQVSRKPSVAGDGFDLYLSFPMKTRDIQRDQRSVVEWARNHGTEGAENVSVGLTCTNGQLPQGLGVGEIDQPTQTSPAFATFKNLIRPTWSSSPPLERDLLWRLLAHLSLNSFSLAKASSLRAVMSLYQFPVRQDKRQEQQMKRLRTAIEEVNLQPSEILHRGSIFRGVNYVVDVREGNFGGGGEIFLFGTVLNEFMSLYATVNATSTVMIRGMPSGAVYQWPTRLGSQPLI